MTPLFRTVVPVKRSAKPLSHKSTIVAVGSCFAETMGAQLQTYRFPCTVNPAGTLFNPFSMADLLERLARKELFRREDLFLHKGLWRSYHHHSRFAGADPDAALDAMNSHLSNAASALETAGHLMLTFGTAAVFYHRERKTIVANCHQLPHDLFERRLLTISEIVDRFTGLFFRLIEKTPSLAILITVSPVRHLRDDPHENCVSKSRLIAAVYELERLFPDHVRYFPAYEIMMDELRDYRFYGPDMTHPSETAIDYLWERFCEANIDERSLSFIKDFGPVVRAAAHRTRNEGTKETADFRESLMDRIRVLGERYPEIDLGEVGEGALFR
jgi:hypothetical protein